MKKLSTSILVAGSFMMIMLLQGCGGSEEPQSETERIKSLLQSATWKLQQVKVDGIDQTTLFAGMTLTISGDQFTTTNGGVVWPASGGWTFADVTGRSIDRNDGVQIAVDEITTTLLVLRLTWDKATFAAGRNASVKGVHVFTFIP
jgi:hypothetical protein